jgi:SAM-dependent methyltransferase
MNQMKTAVLDSVPRSRRTDFHEFMRREEDKVVSTLGKKERTDFMFTGGAPLSRRLKLTDGYHNCLSTYYGRVINTFGANIPEIRHGGKVLDWGCSKGYTTFELANIHEGCSVIGIELRGYMKAFMDHTTQMVEDDPRYLRRITEPWVRKQMDFRKRPAMPEKFVFCDGFKAPFRSGTFDAVYCMNNLYFALNLMPTDTARARFKAVARLIKPGGYLLVSGNNEGGENSVSSFVLRRTENGMRFEHIDGVRTARERLRGIALAVAVGAPMDLARPKWG